MNNKQYSKWDMGKGLETFLIISALVSRVNLQRTVLQIPCRTLIPSFSNFFS